MRPLSWCAVLLSACAGQVIDPNPPCGDGPPCLSEQVCVDATCRPACVGSSSCEPGTVCSAGACLPLDVTVTLTVPGRVLQGERGVEITARVEHDGPGALTIESAELIFAHPTEYSSTRTDSLLSVPAGSPAELSFAVDVGLTAPLGYADIDIAVGLRGTPHGTDPPAQWIVHSQPILSLGVLPVPTTVSRGQSVQVDVDVTNAGTAAADVSAAALVIDNPSDYVPTRTDVVSSIDATSTVRLSFSVDIATTATPGPVNIDATLTATAVADGADMSVAAADTTGQWIVQLPAVLSLGAVVAPPAVARNEANLAVTVELTNTGEATAAVLTAELTFAPATGYTVRRTDTVTSLAGGQGATLVFEVDVGASATLGSTALDATATGRDTNSDTGVTDPGADAPAAWDVSGIRIVTTDLPDPTLGTGYNESLAYAGGVPPVTWTITGGILPRWLDLAADGVLTGDPLPTGESTFSLRVTDSAAATAVASYTITAPDLPVLIDNVARGAPVIDTNPTDDGTWGDWVDVTDGTRPSGWGMINAGDVANATIDLGSVVPVRAVLIFQHTNAGFRMNRATLELSDDNVTFAEVASGKMALSDPGLLGVHFQMDEVGRYVRVTTTDRANSHLGIGEVEVYSQPLAPLATDLLATTGTTAGSIELVWVPPTSSYDLLALVRRYRDGDPRAPLRDYPTEIADGDVIWVGRGSAFIDTGLTAGIRYYYTLFTLVAGSGGPSLTEWPAIDNAESDAANPNLALDRQLYSSIDFVAASPPWHAVDGTEAALRTLSAQAAARGALPLTATVDLRTNTTINTVVLTQGPCSWELTDWVFEISNDNLSFGPVETVALACNTCPLAGPSETASFTLVSPAVGRFFRATGTNPCDTHHGLGEIELYAQ